MKSTPINGLQPSSGEIIKSAIGEGRTSIPELRVTVSIQIPLLFEAYISR